MEREKNFWLMRQFYAEYQERPKLQPLVREISWTKKLRLWESVSEDVEDA